MIINLRQIFTAIVLLSTCHIGLAQEHTPIVADGATRRPLAGASVFDRAGKFLGVCNTYGRTPHIYSESYPIAIRHLGFREQTVEAPGVDTIFLQENITVLPEVVVESRHQKMLHMLAYVREYSTLSTYTDTISLFREKMVDYMIPSDPRTRYRGWTTPRVLSCQSYYRFTDSQGRDGVSSECNQHFSWSDWIGVVPSMAITSKLLQNDTATDTVKGKYMPSEIWVRTGDRLAVDIDVLADTASRRWVPNLSAFFRDYLDFENFRLRFTYADVVDDSITPGDLTGYSFNVESRGRGHGMFMFNRINEPFFVSTYAEIYMVDKEYITVTEAKKWERRQFTPDEIAIYIPQEAPSLQPSTLSLIDRVNSINAEEIRLARAPDRRYIGGIKSKENFGTRVLSIIKNLTGVSSIRAKRNMNQRWREFRRSRVKKNKVRKAE